MTPHRLLQHCCLLLGAGLAAHLLGTVRLESAEAPGKFKVAFAHVVLENGFPAGETYHGDCKGIGDIDGDGFPDVIFAGNRLAWYAYPEWSKVLIADAENEFTTDMQIGDVDGDGDPDIIVPDGPLGKLSWFENPRPRGNPKATGDWRKHRIGEQGTWAHDVEIGDFDADGRLDVVTRKAETILWLQTNPGSFARIILPEALQNGEGLGVGDVNGDSRPDILQNGYWLENPPQAANGSWTKHVIDAKLPRQVSVTAFDVNADGRLDVLFAPAESAGSLSWYEAPEDPVNGNWVEHIIDPQVSHIHTFKIADVNRDGQPDLVTAEMHQSKTRRVSVYYKDGNGWKRQVLAVTGSHNLRVGDIGSDGDIDIVGANWGGEYHPLELWENKLLDRP